MTLTFMDSGVLIAAARGQGDIAMRAQEILDDPGRTFAASDFVRLEVLPKTLYHTRKEEAEFYQAFFEAASAWAQPSQAMLERAYDEAVQAGLSAMDALHIAAALSVGADEFITTEKGDKPLHRVRSLAVRSIAP